MGTIGDLVESLLLACSHGSILSTAVYSSHLLTIALYKLLKLLSLEYCLDYDDQEFPVISWLLLRQTLAESWDS